VSPEHDGIKINEKDWGKNNEIDQRKSRRKRKGETAERG